jgi:integrase
MARDGDKLRSKRLRESMLRRQAFPAIGHVPIALLKKSQIIELLDKIEDESGPVAADRLLAVIRRVLNWHAEREDDYRPPLLRLKPRKSVSEQARDRVLDDRELRAVWKVSGEMPGPFAALVRFLLLTAARRTEASAMTWSEVKDGAWTLPRERNKVAAQNKGVKDLVRPLSAAASAVLEKQLNIEGCPYVFSYGNKPMTTYSKSKKRFDEAVAAVLAEQDAKEGRLPIPIPNWTLHDLRRTARTLMSRADVRPHHAERCLGHIIRGVEGVYDRHRYLDEMLAAYEALARQIETIVNPPTTDNVVVFGKA